MASLILDLAPSTDEARGLTDLIPEAPHRGAAAPVHSLCTLYPSSVFQTNLIIRAAARLRISPASRSANFSLFVGLHRNTSATKTARACSTARCAEAAPRLRFAGQITHGSKLCRERLPSVFFWRDACRRRARRRGFEYPPPAVTCAWALLAHCHSRLGSSTDGFDAELPVQQPMNINFGLLHRSWRACPRGKSAAGCGRARNAPMAERRRSALRTLAHAP